MYGGQLTLSTFCILLPRGGRNTVSLETNPLFFLEKAQLFYHQMSKRGLVSEETVVLRRWGSDTRKFGLSIDHRTEIEKLTFRALALRHSL